MANKNHIPSLKFPKCLLYAFCCVSFSWCAAGEESFFNLAEDFPCGEVALNGNQKEPKIIGGRGAESGEFPFLASIQKSDGKHFCSAFIVKSQVLVTAAHCFIDAMFGSDAFKQDRIVVGSNDWTYADNHSNVFKISNVTIHPKYSYLKPNVENDIALLKIDRPVQWSSRVRPICLARSELVNHEYGIIAGWGIRTQNENKEDWLKDTTLHKVALPIWTNKACRDEYRKHRVNWNTRSTHLCAGFQNKLMDTCQGDSGSPLLVIDGDGKRIAHGIVSVGEGCATRLPGIYTRISSFTNWIMENS